MLRLVDIGSSTAGWASIAIITVQLLTDAGLLQVHAFIVNVVAPYRHINEEMAGARFLLQVYRKDMSVCPNNLISISVTISISASWLSANWIVGELVCRRVVQLPQGTPWHFVRVCHNLVIKLMREANS